MSKGFRSLWIFDISIKDTVRSTEWGLPEADNTPLAHIDIGLVGRHMPMGALCAGAMRILLGRFVKNDAPRWVDVRWVQCGRPAPVTYSRKTLYF